MKTGYEKKGNKTYFNIELSRPYEDNYKIHMLQENDIQGILPVCGFDEGKGSKYRYTVTGMTTMETRFGTEKIKQGDIIKFLNCLCETIEVLHRYMMDPNGIFLHPKFLFWDKAGWMFCYIPVKKRKLNEAFHELIEYFEKKADDKNKETVSLIYRLHKATLEKNYDLIKILRRYKEYDSDEHVFTIDDGGLIKPAQPKAIKEHGEAEGLWKRKEGKFKKNYRGIWKALIAETDGHGEEETL